MRNAHVKCQEPKKDPQKVPILKKTTGLCPSRSYYSEYSFSHLQKTCQFVSCFIGQDLDVVMKDGMGMRYAFMGPMETIHLNADGTQNYCDRYGDTIYSVSMDLGPVPTGWK